ncbi:MAG: hypothetical protein J6Y02_20845 [Pseudobutyrivibrio sp.]|nr:hypothetical protein [Pseudobutyrivibrio sp.]
MGQSRNENILENMLGAHNPLGEPQSREEALLMQILEQGGGGGSSTLAGLTDVSVTSPSNEQILKYDSETGKWVNDNIENEIELSKTAGPSSTVSFISETDMPLKSVLADVVATGGNGTPDNPIPINGYSSANITRCGVNLWGGETLANDFSEVADYTKDTVNKTFTFSHRVGADQTIIDGTRFKPNTQYTFIFRYTAISENSSLRIVYSDNSRTAITFPTANTKSDVVVTSTASKTIVAVIMSYYTDGLTTVYYDESGLFEGVVTLDDFTPYNGDTVTIAFSQTVYGGVLDVTRGKAHVTHKIVDLGDLNWINENDTQTGLCRSNAQFTDCVWHSVMICSAYNYNSTISYNGLSDGDIALTNSESIPLLRIRNTDYSTYTNAQIKEAVTGMKLVYQTKTPFDIDLTPEVISAIVGENNVFADCGDITVGYYTSIGESIHDLVEESVKFWTDISGTLEAGETEITLTNSAITTSSTIEVFDSLDVPYVSKELSAGSITLTFDVQDSDMSVKVRVS